MVVQKEDLGLSLSINFPENPINTNASNCSNPLQLNLRQSLTSSLPSTSPFNIFQKASLPQTLLSSETCRVVEPKPFLKKIDVNTLPLTEDAEEEAGISSLNSTISSVSGKTCERDSTNNGEEIETGRASSRGMSDEEDWGNSRKKLRLSKDQSVVLEESFKEHNTLNPKQKLDLGRRLGLRPRQVEVWFQNRRARIKLKQTEVDCEYLKKCCESLTEENMRLQKEIQELRASKLASPQLYMHMTPPTTLNMCTSCERVAVPQPSTAATPSATPTPGVQRGHHMRPRPMLCNIYHVPHRPFDALLTRS